MISSAAPTEIAESATLNDGNAQLPNQTWMKVRDVAQVGAIDEIADCSAQNERQASRQYQLVVFADTPQPDDQHDAHNRREYDKKPALPAARIGEKTECRTGVSAGASG